MFRQFVRGYGILILGSLGILAAFLFYQNYKQDVLEYSLDLIGDKLVAMAPDDTNRASMIAFYDSFKERVIAREIAPEQVEHVAENILNLGTSGATVTSEQAKAMLQTPHLAIAVQDVQGKEEVLPATYTDTNRFTILGKRLKTLCDMDTEVQAMISTQDGHRKEIKQRIHYECADGVRIVVDPHLKNLLPPEAFDQFASNMKQFEKDKMIVWKENLAIELEEVRQNIEADMQSISEIKEIDMTELLEDMKQLKALKGLESHDFHFNDKIIKEIVAKSLKHMEKNKEHLEEVKANKNES